MEHVRRNERLPAIMRMLVDEPNTNFSLSQFCEAFGAAKSTISEDLDIIRGVLDAYSLGTLETLAGAAGGVRFRPTVGRQKAYDRVNAVCQKLQEPGRVLPGGLLFCADILSDPALIASMGEILASVYYGAAPDFVLTMEAQGIPLAMMTARALGIPSIVARRNSKVYEGPAVHINYLAGSQFKTMSLARRLVREGQRALLVDDILRSGGTISGMMDLMREFNVEVVGSAVLLGTKEACQRHGDKVRTLMVLEETDAQSGCASVRPADWLKA